MEHWIADIEFERLGLPTRLLKKCLVNPLANHLPVAWFKKWLTDGQSELAKANWADPGGWRSMVISYGNDPQTTWDKLLVRGGTIPMALRNRRKLASRLIARLLDEADHSPTHALCLGAGPGHIITDAMVETHAECDATLVDLSSDAFDYGRQLAEEKGVLDRVRFIQGDVREVRISERVDVVKMIGICEYLEDQQIRDIVTAAGEVMYPGAAIVFNSISKAHGTERFLHRVFGLNMIHRSSAELEALLGPCGFGAFQRFPEPLGVYEVCIARRQEPS